MVVIPEEKNPVRNPSRTQTNVGQIHSRVGSRAHADAKSGEKIDSRNQTHGESESTRGGESDGERFSTNETFNHEVLRVKIAVTRRVVANADAEKHASDGGRDARGGVVGRVPHAGEPRPVRGMAVHGRGRLVTDLEIILARGSEFLITTDYD